ncbi:hypothetical protein L228DRAFT_233038 [Xylona heveae TC161]|uniref:Phosphoribosylaminoimidazole-succinocarboxamide synthase n=1 Tax=Xylona heveae (strain CBS 132557 / TC161) TaxID=1328760 RepID=A0A165AGF6_XYLHT|nr:hypothetical protein L228DRAFT_233038 [Xylona heveae TC161]KZF20433.1 hypothetical protein L228DRAFT_233038 [Xylona heveae TC161]
MNSESPKLHSVNVSQPQLLHSVSRQSIAASDDFYSFSESGNDLSSQDGDRSTVVSCRSPSRLSPATIYEDPLSEPESLSARDVMRMPSNLQIPSTVRAVPSSQRTARHSSSRSSRRPVDADRNQPTPGMDDTPYIRFAIDQLTRDEEEPEPHNGNSRPSEDYPVDRLIHDEGLGYLSSVRNPRRGPHSRQEERDPESYGREVFVPIDTPANSLRYPHLNFLPGILRPVAVGALLFCCLLMLAGLIFCGVWSNKHHGLWDYKGLGGGRYFVFQFLPQMLAAVILLWLFALQTAACRVLPFVSMASTALGKRTGALFTPLFQTRFLLPQFAYFRNGHVFLGACFSVFWLSVFTLPLQCSLFQVRYLSDQGVWRWSTVQPVVWTLVALYALLSIALVAIAAYFFRRSTGLRWDPSSLADVLVLLQQSNILDNYTKSEIMSRKNVGKRFSYNSNRLGYWKTSERPADVFYAIGEEGPHTRRYSVQQGRLVEKPTDARLQQDFDPERQRPVRSSTNESLRRDIYSSHIRYRWTPWFLRTGWVISWIVIGFALLIAFLVVSFVKNAIKHGWLPLLPAAPNSEIFSSANFLYSFLPSLLGTILFLAWQPIDMYFRALQPYANLANPNGVNAEKSLLLDYTSCFPIEVTVKAVISGHSKVAWFSFMSIVSVTLPVLAGGVFWAELFVDDSQVRMAADLSAFYAIIVFLIIYVLSLACIWPTKKRYLPHGIATLAEIISFVYQSPLLGDLAFKEPKSKTDLVTRLLSAPPRETAIPLYAFGVYLGRDGREHLGIDRLQRPGAPEMIITTGG